MLHSSLAAIIAAVAVPQQCAPFDRNSPARAPASSSASSGGTQGGAWSQCVHLKAYGINIDFGLANVLHSLAPRSALEFGPGLGTYTSFLHRVGGVSPSIGIEPEPMPTATFGPGRGSDQLVANVVNASGNVAACEAALGSFDLVFSIEVAEHIPMRLHGAVADFLVRHTRGFLIFSAGRPGQSGIGHVGNRARASWEELFTSRGLLSLPKTSARLRAASRNNEHRKNVMAFASMGAPLGRAYDDDAGVFAAAVTSRRRPGSPPPMLAWLVDAACAMGVPRNTEARNRDKCNATHGVDLGSRTRRNQSVPLPRSLAPTGVRVPWLARHRLREGELFLWPELVIAHAECYAYNPEIRQRLQRALARQLHE